MKGYITISIEEYNKLLDMHIGREELPEKIEVKKLASRYKNWMQRIYYSIFCYNKNVKQQRLIKHCINKTASVIRNNMYGYWRGDVSDYFKDGNFDVSLKEYKYQIYKRIMDDLANNKL